MQKKENVKVPAPSIWEQPGRMRRWAFAWMLKLYSKFRYSKIFHPQHTPTGKVSARRFHLGKRHFDFLLAGEQGQMWYGDTDNISAVKRLGSCIPEGGTVLDFGAHQGFFTMAYSLMAGPRGTVFAVEPFDHLSDVIRFNAALNKFTNIHVLNCGLDDGKGIFKIPSISVNSPVKDEYAHYIISLHLDDFAVLKPDFVKMDIEGYELQAFRHADLFLKQAPVILLSLHPLFIQKRNQANCDSIFETLRKHDYVFGQLNRIGEFMEKPLEEMAKEKGYDVVAVPRSKMRLNVRPEFLV